VRTLIITFFPLSFFLLFQLASSGQSVTVIADNKPLNKVLIGIIESNDVNISFDDELLSQINISINSTFSSLDETLTKLLYNTHLSFEYIDGVCIIYPIESIKKKYVSGIITDKRTSEALPYSHIKINGWPTYSSLDGNFSYTTNTMDTTLNIKVSHLGYYILDTNVRIIKNLNLKLIPSVIGLSEIVISDKKVEKSTQFGDQPGLMKLNHKIAHQLPGYGDNSVFNLIRLMPGVLASGEQTSELIIWGGYAGQSKVIFDGFTVFGIKNFNDNISSFNPLMAKDIEINKGGYDVNLGGRVGGVVNIIGKNGNLVKPTFTFSINNMTINGMAEVPLSKRSSLILAFRHTYYNLYNPSDLSVQIARNNGIDSTNDLNLTVMPDYMFRDVNIKYSATFKNNDLFFISLHAGDDKFKYSINESVQSHIIEKDASDNSTQIGVSSFYSHNWNNGNVSNLVFAYSSIASSYKDNYKILFPEINSTEYKTDEESNNMLEEYSLKFSNRISINKVHTIEAGTEFTHDFVKLDEYSFDQMTAYYRTGTNRISVYTQDIISPTKNLQIKTGLRVIHSFSLKKTYLEPRFSASLNIGNYWKVNSAIGIYNQFISISTVYDDFGNFKYFWTICDNEDIPVLKSIQFVLGTKYHRNKTTFNIEGYYKSISGLTRFFNNINYNIQDIFHGSSKSYGVDVILKQEISKHSVWIAYSLSQTMESFQYYNIYDTRRAPQDQRHEIKVAAMFNLDPLFISSNYVYGSGFPYGNGLSLESSNSKPYSRLDVSMIYKFLDRRLKGEAGISILNVLNTKNIKYQNFEKIPASQQSGINIITEALPITPTIYLKFSL